MMIRICLFFGLLLAASQAMAGTNVVVVLDDSGSMNDQLRSDRTKTKIQVAKDALITVLEKVAPDAKAGVVLLNGSQGTRNWVIPLGPIDKTKMRTAIQRIRAAGVTPLGERMKNGADALLSLRDEEHYGFYRLLIVTDGEATDERLVEQYLPDILSRGITLDVIGVDMAANHSLATRVHTYRSADDPTSLREGIAAAVLAESLGDTRGAGKSDFELLVGIPNDLATACLFALAESGNHPIGEKPKAPSAPPETTTVADPRAAPSTPVSRPTPARQDSGGGLAWIFGLGIVVVLVIVVIKLAGRQTL